TIPELGTRRAHHPPIGVLTSNRTRDLHDALKRLCLYHWIDYPHPVTAARSVGRRVPDAQTTLAAQAAAAVAGLRELDLQQPRGVAEPIGWAAALTQLGVPRLDREVAAVTLGSVLKYREDQALVRERGTEWLVGD